VARGAGSAGWRWRGVAAGQALPCGVGLLLSGLSARLATMGDGSRTWLAGMAAVLAVGCFVRVLMIDLRIVALAGRARRMATRDPAPMEPASAPLLDGLAHDLDRIDRLHASIERRLMQRHPATGLPTREPLFARIAQEAATGGLLGIVTLTDFEKLCAFEPDLAQRTFAIIVARTRRMLGEDRLIAHVDRARLAIWYDAGWTPELAIAQLEALAYALSDAIRDGERDILPEIRIGTARAPQDGTRPDMLFARAIGGLFPPHDAADPVETARLHYELEQDLRRAIDREELELHFQPLIDAKAGRVFGAEALLRWNHREQGYIPPALFVPIMEASGLAEDVGLWVLNSACREARDWQRQALPGLRVAVNVSGQQLGRADLARLIERTLTRHSLAPETLEIELTETVAASDIQRSARLFQHLRELGVAIAIDDFGTGYSSFSTLRTIAFDKMKIDREFITDVDQRPDSQAICRAILALGDGLGIRVVAEGVEQRSEYQWLRRHGCAYFQGYYFAPPLDAEAFRGFVRDERRLSDLLAVRPSERLRA
jgi:Amt family ammonium transporter